MTIGYKWLNDSNESSNGNEKPWELDVWKEWTEKLELCQSGYHACRTPLQSLQYVYGNRWYVVEAEGQFKEAEKDKFVCKRMRIIHELPAKEIMLRFAIACAKNSLFRFENQYPNDDRPRKAIEIAEVFLLYKATKQECELAWSAAWSAESAAWSAAESAGSAAWSAAESAESAAWSAAESAGSAARSAAESAGSAARSAAESAGSAARSAGSAESAWSAAESAESAEHKWQNRTLERIIREY